MGVFDQAARYLVKREPAGFFRWLVARFVSAWDFQGWLDTSRITFPGEPDRICDTVAEFANRADPGRRCVLDVEFQSEPDPDILERLAEYAIRIRRELLPGTVRVGKPPVVGVLLNLTGPDQPDVLDMTVPELSHAGLRLQVVQRALREGDAPGTLAGVATGQFERCVLPWIPLMRGPKIRVLLRSGGGWPSRSPMTAAGPITAAWPWCSRSWRGGAPPGSESWRDGT